MDERSIKPLCQGPVVGKHFWQEFRLEFLTAMQMLSQWNFKWLVWIRRIIAIGIPYDNFAMQKSQKSSIWNARQPVRILKFHLGTSFEFLQMLQTRNPGMLATKQALSLITSLIYILWLNNMMFTRTLGPSDSIKGVTFHKNPTKISMISFLKTSPESYHHILKFFLLCPLFTTKRLENFHWR